MEDWFTPYQTSPLPPAKRVLILAPHPDDEIFGCGGAAFLYRQQGIEVDVVVVTDGASNAQADERPQIFATRQTETNAALALLGVSPATFWGLHDRGANAAPGLPLRMAELLNSQMFDVVFTPSLREIHPDHKACTHALLATLEQSQARGTPMPTVMFYEVGVPLQPNCLIDITPAWPQKNQAMESFASQQTAQDYARQIGGLNAYRSYTLGPNVQQAEAYRLITADALWQEVSGHRTGQAPGLHWHNTVLAAAEASQEAMHTQLAAQNRLVASFYATATAEREKLSQQLSQDALARQDLKWQVGHQTQEIQALKLQIEQQKQHLDERNDQINALKWTTEHQSGEVSQLIQDIQQAQSQLRARQAELDVRSDQIKALQWTADTQAAEIQTIRQTLWWRLGSPLRWVQRQLATRTG